MNTFRLFLFSIGLFGSLSTECFTSIYVLQGPDNQHIILIGDTHDETYAERWKKFVEYSSQRSLQKKLPVVLERNKDSIDEAISVLPMQPLIMAAWKKENRSVSLDCFDPRRVHFTVLLSIFKEMNDIRYNLEHLPPEAKQDGIDAEFMWTDLQKHIGGSMTNQDLEEEFAAKQTIDTYLENLSSMQQEILELVQRNRSCTLLEDECKKFYGALEQFLKPLYYSCASCTERKSKMKRCSGCQDRMYCSVTCQKKEWREHKKVCTKL